MNKTLQEMAIAKGKILLVENRQINVDISSIQEFETPQLFEDANGGSFYGLALIKGMPISDFKKNRNGRNYPEKEWVTALKEITKTYCLANHPSDSGSVDNINGIWQNPVINRAKQVVEADLVVADNEKGKTLLFCAKNGLLEVSTSSFGNLTEDGTVYDLEIERLSDHVIGRSNPSAIIGNDVTIIEKNSSKDGLLEKKNTNYAETKDSSDNRNIQENNEVIMDNFKDFEKVTRNTFREQLNSAVKSENISEAINRISKFDAPDGMLKEKEDALMALQIKLSEQVTASKNEIEAMTATNSELTEEVEKYNVALTEAKATIDKMNEMFKLPEGFDSQEELYENYGRLYADMSKVKSLFENEVLKEREIENLKDIVLLAESAEIMDTKIGELVASIRTIQEEKVEAIEKENELHESCLKAETRVKEYETLLEDTYGHVFEKDEDEDEEDSEDEDESKDDKDDKKEKKDEAYKFEGAKKLYEGDYGISGEAGARIEDTQVLQENEKAKIKSFYADAVKDKPAISAFKETILSLDTLMEAVKIVNAFGSMGASNDSVNLNETEAPKKVMSLKEKQDRAYGLSHI